MVSTGYGLLSAAAGQPVILEYGAIVMESGLDLPSRLQGIYQGLADICGRYHPQAMAIEDLFYNKNVRTAMTVGHVRGVIILAGMHRG